MKILLTILKTTTLLVFVGIMVLTIGAYLNLPLPLKPLVVKTGSMDPTIPVGSLVLVTEKSNNSYGINYVENDVITFRSGKELVSHRVVRVDRAIGEKRFVTKGDENQNIDTKLISEKDVVGKVSLAIPYVGKFVDFVKTPLGFFFLIAIPTLFIILSEVIAVWEELRRKHSSSGGSLDFAKPLAMFFMATIFMGSSHAFFSDVATSTNNTFTAAAIFPGSPGSVVINEINWSGSDLTGQDGQNDEWLELKNMTSSPINLAGWKIAGAITGAGDLIISSGTIPANGYFLISNFDETVSRINAAPDFITTTIQLDNSNAQYILKNDSGSTIDTADDGSGNPFAGTNAPQKRSMERKSPPGDGIVSTNWQSATTHTNMDGSSLTDEFGTPKAANP